MSWWNTYSNSIPLNRCSCIVIGLLYWVCNFNSVLLLSQNFSSQYYLYLSNIVTSVFLPCQNFCHLSILSSQYFRHLSNFCELSLFCHHRMFVTWVFFCHLRNKRRTSETLGGPHSLLHDSPSRDPFSNKLVDAYYPSVPHSQVQDHNYTSTLHLMRPLPPHCHPGDNLPPPPIPEAPHVREHVYETPQLDGLPATPDHKKHITDPNAIGGSGGGGGRPV